MRIAATLGSCLTALTASLCVSTIDISSKSIQQLQSGYTLEFSSSRYATYAAKLGSPEPDPVDFVFSSLPASSSGEFTASLESLNGDGLVLFNDPLSRTSGSMRSAQYTATTSSIVGALALSPIESANIFSNEHTGLPLTYSGPTITVGIPGYTLPHERAISLSGGSLSMGAMAYSAEYESAVKAQTRFTAGLELGGPLLPAPEPKPLVLFASGIGLCAFAGVLRRWTRRRASL